MTNPDVKILVDNVRLRYSDGIEPLQKVTLPIYKNQMNVIFGPSGGGKSSLLRLFNRLNDLADVVHLEGRVLLRRGKCLHGIGLFDVVGGCGHRCAVFFLEMFQERRTVLLSVYLTRVMS